MMNRFGQALGVLTHRQAVEGRSTIDFIHALGPARARLRQGYGAQQMDVFEVQSESGTAPVETGIATEKGKRARNEDSAVVMLAHLDTGPGIVPVVLAAVADGMGGKASGDVASAITLQTVTEYVVDKFIQPGSHQPAKALYAADVEDMLTEAVNQAHLAVKAEVPHGGSTVTGCLIIGRTAYVAHVGDSRAYLIDSGGMELLTRDHLFVRRLQEEGFLTEEEVEHHPRGHVLYRAVGSDSGFEVDVTTRLLDPDSWLLLCTDGVWGALNDTDFFTLAGLGWQPQALSEKIVADALRRGARDNVTAVAVHLPDR